jgi:hypothetical protein
MVNIKSLINIADTPLPCGFALFFCFFLWFSTPCVLAHFIGTIGNDFKISFFILCSTDDFVLEPYETEITTESSPFAISLARHLHSIGAKMYGAFWCSHCNEQKQVHIRSPY